METLAARDYHERTKHTPRGLRESGFSMNADTKPRPYKVYRDLPTAPLPGPENLPDRPALDCLGGRAGGSGDADDSLDRQAVADLCYYATGVTKTLRRRGRDVAYRAAACTGKLYHVDCYLATASLPDLAAGVYHYDPREHALDVLREGDHRAHLADAAGDRAVADAPAVAVTTSTWWRNAWKYRERTYRHAFWDSGTVLANLLATAATLERPATVLTGFADEQVADLLGVDVAREAPLELVPVGAGAPAGPAPDVTPLDPATEPLSSEERRYEAIEAAYRASSLPDGAAVREWRAGARPVTDPGDDEADAGADARGERVHLAPVGPERASGVPLDAAVRRRGSCREYVREALNPRKVATVLDRATRGPPMDVRDPDGPRLQYVTPYLLVNGVAGWPAGAYRYDPDDAALVRVRAGACRREAERLALNQRLGGDAALCVYFLADLDAVTDRLGDRGYRVAQLEAAVAAGRLYLAAAAHRDLGSTGLTFFDDAVSEFLGTDLTPTFLWTLGRPA